MVGKCVVEVTIRNTRRPDGYCREELFAMMQKIRDHADPRWARDMLLRHVFAQWAADAAQKEVS